jgi:hypothetical protein
MLSLKLLLAVSVMTGLFADQCGLGDLGVEDFADKVTVSNIGPTSDAFVSVKFNHGQVSMGIEAGKSRTAIALAATKYTVKVLGRGDSYWVTYKDTLLRLREQLQELTLSSNATPDQIANAATELTLVLSALEQMNGSAVLQSCSGKLVSGVTSQVTVKWTTTADGTGLWVLVCG